MAAPTAFSEVDILTAQGDAATDPSLSVNFYEAAKKLPTNKTAAADLLCKLSAAYLRRGREGDVSLAVVYSTTAASVRPDARAFLQCSKAKLAHAVSQRTHADCGESMRHSFQEAMRMVSEGLALSPDDEGLSNQRAEIARLVATLKPPSTPCDVCNRPAEHRCARCGLKTYCSLACQRIHWPLHKSVCRAPRRPIDGAKGYAQSVSFGDVRTLGYYPDASYMRRSSRVTDRVMADALSACDSTLLVHSSRKEGLAAAYRTSAAELNAMKMVPQFVFSASLIGSLWATRGRGIVMALGAGLSPNININGSELFDNSVSLLAMTIIDGNVDAVKLLLDLGAHVDRGCPSTMCTPLLLATSLRHEEIVQALLDAGADLRAASTQGYTLLHNALENNVSDAAAALPAVCPTARLVPRTEWCQRGHRIVQMLCAAGAPLESLNCHGLAPLHVAAADGDVVAIRLLVDGGANVHVRSGNGAYPLAFAERNGHATAAALLKKLSK